MPIKNELNNKYGMLTVIAQEPSTKYGKAQWKCRCDCGNYIITTGERLRIGQTVSCGCQKKIRGYNVGKSNAIDITGQKFGILTALNPIGSSTYGGVLWKCQCDCGNIHIAEMSNLKSGQTKSCGCLKSFGEYKIQQILNKYKIDFKHQYVPQNFKLESGYKPYYDFGIFNKNQLICLIEYNGEQHYKYSVSGWNTKDNYDQTIQRDQQKIQLCKDNNIKLYIISYKYIDKLEEKILEILEKENLTFN